jgi:hypothetical protein
LVKIFEAAGFRCVRTEGDHMVVIPKYAAVPVFVIKHNLMGGISRERYFELLRQ